MAEEEHLTIGEVINLLKDDFPDATVSKVRFLESQGLITPTRSASGYRQFTADDVKRLRFIMEQQRDWFLPLKVIRSQLTLWERGEEPSPVRESGPASIRGLLEAEDDEELLDEHELAARAKVSREQVRELVRHGLITPYENAQNPMFSTRHAAIVRQCGTLMEMGLEPRHLRSVRHSAERSADLLIGLTAPVRRRRNPQARREAMDALADCSETLNRLMTLLFSVEIRSVINPD